ncbi:MAG: serine/threonine-protein kinase [Gemmataceae bacterium]
MPAPTTVIDFIDLVARSNVLEKRTLDGYLQTAAAAPDQPATPKVLAQNMVRDGLLTALQAGLLLKGKWRNFIVSGKYKLLEHLGTGGMGSVYLCEHVLMRRRVALKVLPNDKVSDAVVLERFYREARAVAALDHRNIVRAHDIDHDGDLHFLVLEYVDGSSLQWIVERFGPLAIPRAVSAMRQTADGLQHAFQAGLMHRDIKPGNLLIDRMGLLKILDLGLARFFDDGGNLTRKHNLQNVLGTADYLAPEQALDSSAVDIRGDIYSLGVTFYFILTGRSPYKDGSISQKLMFHQISQPTPIHDFRPDVPKKLAAVIEKMMAKDPAQRFQTPAEVLEALEPWDEGLVIPRDEEMPQLSPAARGSSTGALPRVQKPNTAVLKKKPAAAAPVVLSRLSRLTANRRLRAAAVIGGLALAGVVTAAAAVLAAH